MSKKKKKKPSDGSLLGRLFASSGSRKKSSPGKTQSKATAQTAKKGEEAPREAPLTPRQRSLREIEQMRTVGQADPERLALMLSRIFASVKAQREREQESFNEMVSDILERNPDDDDSDDGA